MTFFRAIEEIHRNQWAITTPALRAMLAVVDGADLDADVGRRFHALAKEEKISVAETFGRRIDGSHYSSVRGNVGFLMIDGPIVPRATWFTQASGLVSVDVLSAEFRAFEEDPRIQTIVLLLDTPGGAVQGISDFSTLVASSSKKTVAFAWMAASAGYWIASAAKSIVVPNTGLVGSIGTVLTITDYGEAEAKRGIRTIEIVSSQSPNKRLDPKTPEGRTQLQTLVDDLADVFVRSVADNRGVTPEKVLSDFGGGAMFVARRALDAGLVDRIEGLESFVQGLGVRPLFGNQRSALAASAEEAGVDLTAEEKEMTNSEKVSAEEIKESPSAVDVDVEAIKAEAKEEGRVEERERIQAIEAIADKVSGGLPSVKSAAIETINSLKYDPKATADTVAGAVLEAVAKAQVGAVENFAGPRRASAEVAEKVSAATPPVAGKETKEAAEARAAEMLIAARDARKGGN